MLDTGGKGDMLNLSTFNSRDVEVWRFDRDNDGTAGSLVVSLDGTARHAIVVYNQFETDDYEDAVFNGRIERVRFKNKTVSPQASSIPVWEPNPLLPDLPGGGPLLR